MEQLDVFMIHGIGKSLPTEYYDGFVAGIRKYLPIDADVLFHPVDYSGLLEGREKTIFSWMKGMGWQKARKFTCDFVCDALAYGYPAREPGAGDFIYDLHMLIGEKMQKVRKDSKIVIIGHSLGSVVGYGLTWQFKTDCLITMGSPFSYFSIRYKKFGEMNPALRQFHNFWRGRDPVSTIISRNPNFKCVHDTEVKSWNPLDQLMLRSHSIYWTSDFVHQKIASILKKLDSESPIIAP